jgi:hypothetical protein
LRFAATSHAVRRVLGGALVVTVLAGVPADAGPSRKHRARVAVRYLMSEQKNNGSFPAFSPIGSTADAVVSMAAARRGRQSIDKAVDYLRDKVTEGKVNEVGLAAKVALAVAAAGRDPKRFGGVNLIRRLRKSELDNGRYGRGTAVFDHALALIALQAGGAQFTTKSVRWMVAAQCDDGGWQYDKPAKRRDNKHCFRRDSSDQFRSDTNTTSLVVQALAYIEESPPEPDVSPFRFFRAIRDDEFKGWGYSWNFRTTDANSTALVIQAYAAEGRTRPRGARKALKRLQYGLCKKRGAFAFTWNDEDGDGDFRRSGRDLGATIGAILGLLEKPLWFPAFEDPKIKKRPPKPDCR